MIDSLTLYDRLAKEMADSPNQYELLGDIDMDLAIVMNRPDGSAFRLMLGFAGINCEKVAEVEAGDEANADCWLVGDLEHFQAMFDNITANGQATGEWTLNTLTLMDERILLRASDPMGWDMFHRFNQTLQEFFDGASSVLSSATSEES
ncbi:MAG: hypothetical protein GY708_19350 [Actinomycetia bacterium]|nr:hypothetical protein [Actinomycetes bacterium]MCP4962032.1 hypothetical protein [Actinomycetes bacterium]